MGITWLKSQTMPPAKTARGNRSKQPAENGAQHAAHDEYHDQ